MKNQLRNNVLEWNNRFPCDRWWRERHGVPYMSSRHQEISFIDQLFEFEEYRLLQEIENKKEYTPNIGDFLKSDRPLVERMKDEFENEFLNTDDG